MEATKETKLTVEDILAHAGLSVAIARLVAAHRDWPVTGDGTILDTVVDGALALYVDKGMKNVYDREPELREGIELAFETALEDELSNRDYVRGELIEIIIEMFE